MHRCRRDIPAKAYIRAQTSVCVLECIICTVIATLPPNGKKKRRRRRIKRDRPREEERFCHPIDRFDRFYHDEFFLLVK